VFLIHSVIQYPAKVIKTIKPITLAEEQLLALPPRAQAGFLPLPLGSYLTYIDTSVTENQAPKARAASPPIALTRKTWPNPLATSIVVWSITTLKGIRGIQLTKHMILNIPKMTNTTAAE